MSNDFLVNPSDSPAGTLRSTVNTYLDPNQLVREWDSVNLVGPVNIPGEAWGEDIEQLPQEVAANIPEALASNAVEGATSELSYGLYVQQMFPPDNDELILQSQLITREAGQAEAGIPIIAGINFLRSQDFMSSEDTTIRRIVDTVTYAVSLDADSLGEPNYVCRKAIFREDTAQSAVTGGEQMPDFLPADPEELTGITEFLMSKLVQSAAPSADEISPEDFM